MLLKVANRLSKGLRDISSGFGENKLATSALLAPFLFSGKGGITDLFTSEGFGKIGDFLGTNTGSTILSGITALLGNKALQGDKDAAMRQYEEMMARLKATDTKFGSQFGGSPFKEEQFQKLVPNVFTGETFDKFEEGKPVNTAADPDTGKAITISKDGGIASLMGGGQPNMGSFGSQYMGSAESNPFNPANTAMGIIPPVTTVQPQVSTLAMGGQPEESTGVPGLSAQMSGDQMMDTIEDNPGITSFFQRKLWEKISEK